MKKLLILTFIFLFSLSVSCSPPDGKLKPVGLPGDKLKSANYKNDTAVLTGGDLRFLVSGEWSEKGGYAFEITIENQGAAEKAVDFDETVLTGDRLEKAEAYLRRNAGEDAFASDEDARQNIVRLKPQQKKTVYLLFKQEMKKEEYFAAGRKGDRLTLELPTVAAVDFEAVSSGDMEAI